MNLAGIFRRACSCTLSLAVGVGVAGGLASFSHGQATTASNASSKDRPTGGTVTPSAPVRPTGKSASAKGVTTGGTTGNQGFGPATNSGGNSRPTNGAGVSAGSPTGPSVSKTGSGSNTTGGPAMGEWPRPGAKIGVSPNTIASPRAPAWIPLPADHEKYLDDVLKFWQDSSNRVKKYRCSFRRWEYDGANVARDPQTGRLPPRTESTGVIRYAAPDKGMFKVELTKHYTLAKEGDRPQYLPHKDEVSEHWVCDGKSIFAFDNQKKQLIQTMLPPEMQGRAIVDGPLPFMFGAEVAKVKQRFWMRVITPKDSTGEYWLEAIPKSRQDAANFKMVHVIIDEKDFLPKAMSIFNLNHDPERNPSCITFAFDKRETNWNETLETLNVFHKEFWEPSTPFGYKKVVESLVPTSPADQSTTPPLPRQAELPKKKK